MHRVRNILVSTSVVEAKRLLPALFRGGFVLLLFLPLLLTSSLTSRGAPISHVLQFLFYLISLIGLIVLAGYVSQETVGSRKSGFISLVALAGISPVKWCLVCICEMWRTFLLIWIVRLPVLAWLHTQGQLELNEVLVLEVLFLCLFAWLSSLGLLIGSGKVVKGVTFGIVIAGYFAWEVICNLGLLLTAMSAYYGRQLPAAVDSFTQLLQHISIFRKVLALISGGFDNSYLAVQLATLLIFTGVCLLRFSQVIFADIGANTLGIEGESAAASPAKKKKATRCWENALAWQAFYYHHNGGATVYLRLLAYLVYIVVVGVMNFFQFSLSEFGSFLFAGVGLITGPLLVANVCLAKEIKEKTLPSLILATGDPVELYKGWQQSRSRMTFPDLFLLPVVLAAVYWSSPVIAYSTACGIAGIACLGPVLFLSPFLAAWTWRNVIISAKIFFALLAITSVSALIGWLINWYLLPVVGIPLLYILGQRVLNKNLPEFFDPHVGVKE